MRLPWFPSFGRRREDTQGVESRVENDAADIEYRFRQAWTQGDRATAVPELLPVRLAQACVAVLPVSGAGLSLLNDDFRVPLGASGPAADVAERLQFTQGEGPCLDAARTGRTVVARAEQIRRRWPAFGEQFAARTPFRAAISIPLPLTSDLRGALDLYLGEGDSVDAVSVAATSIVSEEIVQALLVAQAITGSVNPRTEEVEPAWLHGPSAQHRTGVWIAMGMLMTQLQVPAADALARLRGYAYSHDMDIDQVAAALTRGTLSLDNVEA
jgi:hypothetical protein